MGISYSCCWSVFTVLEAMCQRSICALIAAGGAFVSMSVCKSLWYCCGHESNKDDCESS